jgi:hypothetical protein
VNAADIAKLETLENKQRKYIGWMPQKLQTGGRGKEKARKMQESKEEEGHHRHEVIGRKHLTAKSWKKGDLNSRKMDLNGSSFRLPNF